MTKITTSALAPMALAASLSLGLACAKAPSDTSRVLANVGGEKITEGEFREIAALIVPKDQLNEFLNNQDLQHQAMRVQVLQKLVEVRATNQYAKAQGLDHDPKVQLQLDASRAQAYQYALVERSLSEPTEAQLKAQYDKMAAAAKAAGQDKGFPSYDEVGKTPQLRAALVQRCQQGQSAEAQQRLQAEIKSAIPVTFGEGLQGAE